MNCPHCSKSIDPALITAARQSELGKRSRPGANGLVRNPKGRPKLCSLCGKRPRSRKCYVMVDEVSESVCTQCYDDAIKDAAARNTFLLARKKEEK